MSRFSNLGQIEEEIDRIYTRMEDVLEELKILAPDAAAADSEAKRQFAQKLVQTLRASDKQPMAMREAFARLESAEKQHEADQLTVRVKLLRDELNMLNNRTDSLRTIAANTRRVDGGRN